MILEFTKMQGAGNSYIIIEDLDRALEKKYPDITRAVSDKGFGIGSDGMLVVNKGSTAKYWMRVFNPDGSEAEMCGNGIRLFARYLYDRNLIERNAEVEAGGAAGGRIVRPVINADSTVTVDMGKGEILGRDAVEIGGRKFSGVRVSVGNPHFVIFTKNEKEAAENARDYGHAIEHHSAFPNRTNVEFVFARHNEIILRVWERGAGLTLACGTGACASALASFKEGRTKSRVTAKLPGGDLGVEIRSGNAILLSGPAEYIFSGSVDIDKLLRQR